MCIMILKVLRTVLTLLVFRDVYNHTAKINVSHKQSFCLFTTLKYILEMTNLTVIATYMSKISVCSVLHLMSY